VMRHHLQGLPRQWLTDPLTGHGWRGTASPSDVGDTPGHKAINRPGIPEPLRRLHAPRRNLTSLLAPPQKAFHCPPTAGPLHDWTRTGQSRDWQTRQQESRDRGRAWGRAGLLGRDRPDRHGGPCASWPTRPIEGHRLGRPREGGRSGRLLRLARECDAERPQGARLRPLGPYIARGGAGPEAPLTRGANHTLCPWPRRPRQRVHNPRLAIPCALGPMHPQRGRTGLCDLTGALSPCPPALTLFCFHGFALALLGHGRLWPRPDFPPHPPSGAPLGRKHHGRVAQRRLTGGVLSSADPGLGVSRAVMEQRGIWSQQHDRLGTDALQWGVGMPRQKLRDAAIRGVHKAIRGHRLGPARTRGRQTADRAPA
jgi:hypothetical protein